MTGSGIEWNVASASTPLSDIYFWYESSDVTGTNNDGSTPLANGGVVTNWVDRSVHNWLSGEGYHPAAQKCRYWADTLSTNSAPYVSFTNLASGLSGGIAVHPGTWVATTDTNWVLIMTLMRTSPGTSRTDYYTVDGGSVGGAFGGSVAPNQFTMNNVLNSANNTYMTNIWLVITYMQSNTVAFIRTNGVQCATGTSPKAAFTTGSNVTSFPRFLGVSYSGLADWTGYCLNIMYWNRTMTASELAWAENYCKGKIGK